MINFGKNQYEDSLLISGWGFTEENSRWAIAKKADLQLITQEEKNYTRLTIETFSLKEPQNITIFLDGKNLGSQKIYSRWSFQYFPITEKIYPGIHEIIFVFSNTYKPSVVMLSADTRDLAVRFKRIQIE